MVLRATVQIQSSKQSFPKVSLKKYLFQKSSAELWTVFRNQVIKYSLPHMQFDQISDHKHDIYLHGKLSAKLLAQAANKNAKPMFWIFLS